LKQILRRIYNYNVTRSILNYITDIQLFKKKNIYTYQYCKEEQKTQRTKEKMQKDKQRSTTRTYKTKDRVTRTPLKPVVDSGAPDKQFLLH
jgi:Zn-dependent peptidase ImmA (M78 family)